MAHDWDIRSRSEACTACTAAFKDKQHYLSMLILGEAGYERADFCLDCGKGQEARLAPYSAWQGIYRKPPAAQDNDPLKKETAESLLRKLIDDEDPQNESVIYILAVMLERKKTLVEKDVTVDDIGNVHRVYEHRKTGETFLILDPQLQIDKLADVQTRVIEMLGGPTPPAEKPTVPPDEQPESIDSIEQIESVDSLDTPHDETEAPEDDEFNDDEFDDNEFEDDDEEDDDEDDDDS